MLTTDGLWEECCRNAARLSQERYSDEVLAKRLSEVYEKVINSERK
jgi:hypothetical protein